MKWFNRGEIRGQERSSGRRFTVRVNPFVLTRQVISPPKISFVRHFGWYVSFVWLFGQNYSIQKWNRRAFTLSARRTWKCGLWIFAKNSPHRSSTFEPYCRIRSRPSDQASVGCCRRGQLRRCVPCVEQKSRTRQKRLACGVEFLSSASRPLLAASSVTARACS